MCPDCKASFNIYFDETKPQNESVCDSCSASLISREDDKIENVKIRLEEYENLTLPLKGHFESLNLITKIDASQGVEKITNLILEL